MEQVWVLSRVPGVGSEPRKGPPCAGPAPRRGSQRSLSEDRDVPAGRGGGSGGRTRGPDSLAHRRRASERRHKWWDRCRQQDRWPGPRTQHCLRR